MASARDPPSISKAESQSDIFSSENQENMRLTKLKIMLPNGNLLGQQNTMYQRKRDES
jgi:hypothetical protein